MSGVAASIRRVGRVDAGPDRGADVSELSLDNGSVSVSVLTYGATVVAVRAPDRAGRRDNVVLALPDLASYTAAADPFYVGSTMGRFARIVPHGRLDLDGHRYELTPNVGAHHVHGGPDGFDARVWRGQARGGSQRGRLSFALSSVDGDQGYPGTLHCAAHFTLDRRDRLTVRFEARTDRPTLYGLSTHVFWNLSGAGGQDNHALDRHVFQLHADHLLDADEEFVPTGHVLPVSGALDFRDGRVLGDVAVDRFYPLVPRGDDVRVAELTDPVSGRSLAVGTDQPGIAIYTGDGLPQPRAGICIQPGPWPHAPQHPGFPNAVLRPGEARGAETTFSFSLTPDAP